MKKITVIRDREKCRYGLGTSLCVHNPWGSSGSGYLVTSDGEFRGPAFDLGLREAGEERKEEDEMMSGCLALA